jgi:hypothetical protein
MKWEKNRALNAGRYEAQVEKVVRNGRYGELKVSWRMKLKTSLDLV